MRRIQNKKHKIGTYEVNKILSCFDNKRYILDDGIHMLPYFQKDLRKQKNALNDSFSQMIMNKKRFSQIIMNKKRFSQIRRLQKDPHKKKRFSHMIIDKKTFLQKRKDSHR